MKNKLKIRRTFVNRQALLEGKRIEKSEEEMTPEEMEAFRDDFTERLMNSIGFVKKTKGTA